MKEMKRDETRRGYALIGILGIAVLAFLILFSSMSSAATAQSDSLMLNETQISHSGDAYSCAAIYGNRIVWTDYRNVHSDIYMYDISTSKETQITTTGLSYPTMERPCIYDNKIVWIDDRSGIREVYMYDLSTNQETQITTSRGWKFYPAIYGDRIAWTENRINNNDIFMYDISTSKETQITTNGSGQYYPDIYGDKIVWVDERNGNEDIYMYDISTSKETQITNNKSDQTNPAIYGNRIVWIDYRNGHSDLYLYDISTNHETQIANITIPYKGVYGPAIYGDRIVWGDYRNGNWDIYMYDLSNSKETQITTNPYTQSSPDIYEDRIVWMENQNGYIYNIYMCTISDKLELIFPIANFTSNVTQGYAPLSVQFTDLSTNSTLRNWDFENDGNIDSTEETPVYVYANPGTYTVNLTATNENGTDSKLATINVLPAPLKIPTITWNNPTDITVGTALSGTQLNAVATDPVSGAIVDGTFTYNPAAGNVLAVGNAQSLKVDFTPNDTVNYVTASKEVTINVLKATPTITWSNPADITAGTALSNTQLNAVASVPGTFVYTPAEGTVLNEGQQQTLGVVFTPIDTGTYNAASKNVTINVLTPVQKIRQLTATVQSLVISGVLTKNEGKKLSSILDSVIKDLDAKNTKTAIKELNAFIIQVEVDVQGGILSSIQGQALVDEANSVINML